MDSLSFQDFESLCLKNKQVKHVQEISQYILNSECIYSPGSLMPRKHMIEVYSDRLKMAKEKIVESSYDLIEFDQLVSNITNSKSNEIGFTMFHTNDFSSLVFYEPDTNLVLGILRATKNNNLSFIEGNYEDQKQMDISLFSTKYLKRNIVKEWR